MLPGCTPWSEDEVRRYRAAGYWTEELLGDLLARGLAQDATRVALVSDAERVTYAELHARVERVAAGLQSLGIGPGDRLVVQLPNSVDFVAVSLALFRLGALPVFALPAHRRHEIVALCAHAEAVAYIMPGVHAGFDYDELAAEVRAHVPHVAHVLSTGAGGHATPLASLLDAPAARYPRVDPGEVAFFLLSGGTTGTPKLIPRTHRDYAYQLRRTAATLEFERDPVYLAALPVAHNAALGCPGLLGTLRAGGKVVLASNPSPGEVFPLIEREGVRLTTLMPSILKLWVELAEFLPADLSRVLFQVGGAWLDPEVARLVHTRLHARLTHWFGMAEGFLSHTRLDDPPEVVAHTTGRPLCEADERRVVDEADQPVAAGDVGELLVRGPYTLRGYYRADDYNRVTFTPDGFLRTGDLVRLTPRGDMVMEGRIKDVINRGGEKVSAGELEQQLLGHPDVRQAAVVALPDPVMVEKTCAFVVPGAQAPSLVELRRFLSATGLAEFKLPDQLELVAELPYTSLGKVNKRELRERALAARAAGGRDA